MQTLTFNTGRTYTECGQRIAATQLESGHIIMVDIDRHLDVMLPAQVEFTQSDIMWAYDHNMYVFPREIDLSYGDYYEIVRQLTDAARNVACI
jgi:hypothetical protein